MNVGITGAGGNVGSTVTSGLKDHFDLTLFDLKPVSGSNESFVPMDCADPTQVSGKFDGLDALIHLAANPWPNAAPHQTLRNNFEATSYVFNEAQKAGVKKIVFASSNFYHEGAVGDFLSGRRKDLIRLGEFPTPQSYYAQSKVYGESLGRHMSYSGTQFVALRIGWTVPSDTPVSHDSAYMRAVFVSHRDLIQAMTRALEVSTSFLPAFCVSNNADPVFDLEETRYSLGFVPLDNSGSYFSL